MDRWGWHQLRQRDDMTDDRQAEVERKRGGAKYRLTHCGKGKESRANMLDAVVFGAIHT